MYFNKELGKEGEKLAAKYLINQHYKILDKNFYTRTGEIDIIAKEKQEIVFIEVKTRSNYKYGEAIDAVDMNKMKHIYKAAQYYIYQKKIENQPIRFDIIEIYINITRKKYYINHIKNIEY